MTPKQLEEIKEALHESVKVTVNGKIDSLRKDFTDYVVKDEAWKKTVQPSIELTTNVKGFGKVFAYIIGTVSVIIGIIYGAIQLLNKLK